MSAANALKAARAAGISFAIEGNKLVVEAPAPPSPEIVENISRHKAEILNLLRSAAAAWSAADWQAFFDERAGILEHDGRLDRLDAEMIAFEDCVDHWLALHGGTTGRLHASCASDWKNLRRWNARAALRWLLDSSKRAAP